MFIYQVLFHERAVAPHDEPRRRGEDLRGRPARFRPRQKDRTTERKRERGETQRDGDEKHKEKHKEKETARDGEEKKRRREREKERGAPPCFVFCCF